MQSYTKRSIRAVNPFRRKSLTGLLDLFRKQGLEDVDAVGEPFYPLERVMANASQEPKSKPPSGTIRTFMNSLHIRRPTSRWSFRSSKVKRISSSEIEPCYPHEAINSIKNSPAPTLPMPDISFPSDDEDSEITPVGRKILSVVTDSIQADEITSGHVQWAQQEPALPKQKSRCGKEKASIMEDPFITESDSVTSNDSGYVSRQSLQNQSATSLSTVRGTSNTVSKELPLSRISIYPPLQATPRPVRSSTETVEFENATAGADLETFKEVVAHEPLRSIRHNASLWQLRMPPTPPPSQGASSDEENIDNPRTTHGATQKVVVRPAQGSSSSADTDSTLAEEQISIVEYLKTGTKWIENTYCPLSYGNGIRILPHSNSGHSTPFGSTCSLKSTVSGLSSGSISEPAREPTRRNSPSLD